MTDTANLTLPSDRGDVEADPVDVILLAYNRLDYLVEMVDALEQRTQWPYRLTVVDNVSGPETRNWLRLNRRRFHQVIFNERNEHLAGFQRGIARTKSKLFVLSDADVLPHPPTGDGCWLTRLVELAGRHPDFGLISTRLDSVTAARDIEVDRKRLIDGELIESSTGVWLNLIRRNALTIPYMSDGISSYSIRRNGFRVGVAADVLATHLGDQDPERHPHYLARKQAAAGLGTVYPEYPELARAARPPLLRELMLAAPVLAALRANGIDRADTVELSRADWPPLAAADERIESCVRGMLPSAATRSYDGEPALAPGGAVAVTLICPDRLDDELVDDATKVAGEWLFVLSPEGSIPQSSGWSLVEERPGPAEVVERLVQRTASKRFQRWLSYSTLEHRRRWLEVFAAASFDGPCRLRIYVLRRELPLKPAGERWRDGVGSTPTPPSFTPPVSRARIGPLLTKASRLARAEWYLLQARRDGRIANYATKSGADKSHWSRNQSI